MLEEKKDMIYLTISDGLFQRYMGAEQPMKNYKRIGGFLTGLVASTKKIKDKDVRFLYVRLKDGDEDISAQTSMYGGAGPDILRCLACAVRQNINIVSGTKVFIEPYLKRKEGVERPFTNAAVYAGQSKLDWAPLMNGVPREQALENLYEEIAAFIKKMSSEGAAPESGDQQVDDLPPSYEEGAPLAPDKDAWKDYAE